MEPRCTRPRTAASREPFRNPRHAAGRQFFRQRQWRDSRHKASGGSKAGGFAGRLWGWQKAPAVASCSSF